MPAWRFQRVQDCPRDRNDDFSHGQGPIRGDGQRSNMIATQPYWSSAHFRRCSTRRLAPIASTDV
jgi:hypothetical protein